MNIPLDAQKFLNTKSMEDRPLNLWSLSTGLLKAHLKSWTMNREIWKEIFLAFVVAYMMAMVKTWVDDGRPSSYRFPMYVFCAGVVLIFSTYTGSIRGYLDPRRLQSSWLTLAVIDGFWGVTIPFMAIGLFYAGLSLEEERWALLIFYIAALIVGITRRAITFSLQKKEPILNG